MVDSPQGIQITHRVVSVAALGGLPAWQSLVEHRPVRARRELGRDYEAAIYVEDQYVCRDARYA
jgi:hypothetical protein